VLAKEILAFRITKELLASLPSNTAQTSNQKQTKKAIFACHFKTAFCNGYVAAEHFPKLYK